MEIGLSSASFYPNVNTEDSIGLIKSLGFEAGEIFLNSQREYQEDFIMKLLEEKHKHGFNINSVHGFSSSFEPFLFDSYKRRRDDMFVYFKQVCKAARILGAKCYTFHGMRFQDLKFVNIDHIIDIYNKLIYTAMEENVVLAQENVSWCMSSDLNFLYSIKEKCKYPLHFTLDIKQAYKANIDPEKYINLMGKSMVNFHINDRDMNNSCLLPGKGEVDYKKMFCKLKEIGYNGIGIIEVYSDNYLNFNEIIKSKEMLCSYHKNKK
ncbi:sugar phosphate isomerase/epimerase [Clostridium sp. DJ247]|uniref:sugar phosphate isomerase/epimerase family protein n=1 Tax=Clostridium sp. DJ247 TaxID=2726188 RepID=UPI00162A9EC7|nr:sugar phosphate isomerase/epimerase [Clostridium sp. DJ247]MBC2579823.1 sugar phosphate isomerase/epimerase [Clostridium sp. DJ247]